MPLKDNLLQRLHGEAIPGEAAADRVSEHIGTAELAVDIPERDSILVGNRVAGATAAALAIGLGVEVASVIREVVVDRVRRERGRPEHNRRGQNYDHTG